MRKILSFVGFVLLAGLLALVGGCGGGGGSESDPSVPVFIDDTQLNVATGTTVALDRSGTIDAQGHTLSYHWDFTSLPPDSQPVLSDPVGARPTFIADKDGVYVAELTVTDETGATSIYTITVTASTTNSAPMANAGPDQNVTTGSTVTLDGSSSSDADSDPLTYSWTLTSVPVGSSAALNDSTVARPTFSADVDGNYVFSLTVNDGEATSTADTITVTASTTTTAPPATPGTVTSRTGRVWMDRNLGASQVATAYNDAAAYGDLYQWGRGTDGHEKRTSTTTTTLSSTDSPGHGSFILPSSSPYDWRSSQNDNLWQGVSGTNNNPCPSGFRLPTSAEWDAERATWGSNDQAGAFASPLKLVSAGYRDLYDGSLHLAGSYGDYWSSSVDGVDARYLYFGGGYADTSSGYRAYGFSVRCLEDGQL